MKILRIFFYFILILILFCVTALIIIYYTIFSEDLGPGEITGTSNTEQFIQDKIDRQNNADPAYQSMADNFDNSIAFKAACDLVFEGRQQPSGYTEPVLHARRLQKKAEIAASWPRLI